MVGSSHLSFRKSHSGGGRTRGAMALSEVMVIKLLQIGSSLLCRSRLLTMELLKSYRSRNGHLQHSHIRDVMG